VGGLVSHSQNFISDPNIVKRLIKQSSISNSDVVFDIGAGKGIITKQLAPRCKKVIAVEVDDSLYAKLTRVAQADNTVLLNCDFLTVPLPRLKYKVFANIPFNYTSRIMSKLYFQANPPESAYLVMQKEAANMYLGYPRETQKSLLLKPFFSIEVFHIFRAIDFKPVPSVEAVMLEINRLQNPHLNRTVLQSYFDFVVYGTTRYKTTLKKSLAKIFTHKQFKRLAKHLGFTLDAKFLDITYLQWIGLYNYFEHGVIDKKKGLVLGSYRRQLMAQRRLKKIYRKR